MSFYPIIIDGPSRGKKIPVDNRNHFVVIKQPKIRPMDHYFSNSDMMSVSMQQVVYNIHWFQIGQYQVAIASVKSTPPSMDKVLKKIFTRAAMDALTVMPMPREMRQYEGLAG